MEPNKTNSGHCSTGNHSTGDYSTGHYSTGNGSTGHCSTGNYSTGDYSTGHYSTGNGSKGHYSTGNYSTGNYSTGDYSTGHYSTGDYSTGNWSISNYSSGHFSTIDHSGFSAFNKQCTVEEWEDAKKPRFIYFKLTEFVHSVEMSEEEKKAHPEHITTLGYLKVYDYKEAWRKAWEGATDEDKELLYNLPNFDAQVFKEISGIDVTEKQVKELTLAEIEELLGYKVKVIE